MNRKFNEGVEHFEIHAIKTYSNLEDDTKKGKVGEASVHTLVILTSSKNLIKFTGFKNFEINIPTMFIEVLK